MAQINDVPPEEVGAVVQDFIDNGSGFVTATRQDDGNFTVSG